MAAEAAPEVTYVGQKISKVCWKPQPAGAIAGSDIFASGSWDDEVNKVCVWRFSSPAAVEELEGEEPQGFVEPELLCDYEIPWDVTALTFMDEMRLAAGYSNGSVTLSSLQNKKLGVSQQWSDLHGYPGGEHVPCTGLAVSGADGLVTCGEDGRINVLSVLAKEPVRTLDHADHASLTALVCTLHSELLTTSSAGQLKLWDLRNHGNEPSRILTVSEECVPLHCLDRHPQQPHLVVVGRGDGSICLWDLRNDKQACQVLKAHHSDVWDIKFHPSHPNNLFTCSQDGSLWHWGPSSSATHQLGAPPPSPWLSGGVAQGRVKPVDYLPQNRLSVNALDIDSQTLVCGTDCEAIWLLPNLALQ